MHFYTTTQRPKSIKEKEYKIVVKNLKDRIRPNKYPIEIPEDENRK